ncbi:hypothetical protein AN958_11045 [Leucoagaricus sp. SymC.cos]|nr:hypothetical protein AN958_11045 [Leucoagaricus sp. SymC.cos]
MHYFCANHLAQGGTKVKFAPKSCVPKTTPQRKSEGPSIMISEFLTVEWGHLVHENEEAHILFKAEKNCDSYFTADDLIQQVDQAINIFKAKTNGFATALFLFNNAPSHQKRADNALSAWKMPKRPTQGWMHCKDGPQIWSTVLPNGEVQHLYFEDDHPMMPGWFKGMEQIICECGLCPEGGLHAQCEGFKCQPGVPNCCCHQLLFNQPDFVSQKSRLQEFIELCGHLCDFYPKYHCEYNFIEQYWGTAKYQYRNSARTSNIEEMEQNMLACLNDVPLKQIRKFANRAAHFISAYGQGLSGEQAAWANRKYHGHRTLPPSIVAEIRHATHSS